MIPRRSGATAVLLRLWKSIGWSGILFGALTTLLIYQIANPRIEVNPGLAFGFFFALCVGLLISASRWAMYPINPRTKTIAEVVDPLTRSREKYCLLLRPFGADGHIVIPSSGGARLLLRPGLTPTSTAEQAIAYAWEEEFRSHRTYAVVDPKLSLSPGGPVYLRASDDEWQQPVSWLIKHAHSIVLVIPPSQSIRKSVWWELSQITQHAGRSARLSILLPPPDQVNIYRRARGELCTILAAIADPLSLIGLAAGEAPRIDPDTVKRWDAEIPKDAYLVYLATGLDGIVRPFYYYVNRKRFRFWPPRAFSDFAYIEALRQAFRSHAKELG